MVNLPRALCLLFCVSRSKALILSPISKQSVKKLFSTSSPSNLQNPATNHAAAMASTAIALLVFTFPADAHADVSVRQSSFSNINYASTITISSDNALFRPNPLTNPVLEKIRIWEQAEADNIKYGGELEAGDAGKGVNAAATYPRLLVPIIQIQKDLQRVQDLLLATKSQSDNSNGANNNNNNDNILQAQDLLQKPYFEKIAFKKIFNSYSDNIYYSDPDRANLYLGGGATPQATQSLAYLYRNDVLTNIEDLQAELAYYLKNSSQNTFTDTSESLADAQQLIKDAVSTMNKFMSLVPPNEIAQATRLLDEKL